MSFDAAKRLVGTGRFELPTCRLGGDRSIHLSYVPDISIVLIVASVSGPFRPMSRAVMHAVEMDLADGGVGAVDGGSQIWARTP